MLTAKQIEYVNTLENVYSGLWFELLMQPRCMAAWEFLKKQGIEETEMADYLNYISQLGPNDLVAMATRSDLDDIPTPLLVLLQQNRDPSLMELAQKLCRSNLPLERRLGLLLLLDKPIDEWCAEYEVVLRELIATENSPQVISALIAVVGRHCFESMSSTVFKFVSHPDESVRETCAMVLAAEDTHDAVNATLEFLHDKSAAVRSYAICGLANNCEIDGNLVQKALLDAVSNSNFGAPEKGEAIYGLAVRHFNGIEPIITDALKQSQVGGGVFRAIVESPAPVYLPDLKRLQAQFNDQKDEYASGLLEDAIEACKAN